MTGKGEAQVRLVAEELRVLITVDLRGVAAALDVDEEGSVVHHHLLPGRLPCRRVQYPLHSIMEGRVQ